MSSVQNKLQKDIAENWGALDSYTHTWPKQEHTWPIRTLDSISVNENFATSVKNRQVQQYGFFPCYFFLCTASIYDRTSMFLEGKQNIIYLDQGT